MIIADEAAMQEFGIQLARELSPGDIVAIDGPLGAGKTVMSRGILRGLGFAGDVSSPSYAIVHEYHPPEISIPVMHIDLYRIEHESELTELGLDDNLDDTIQLIEWAQQSAAILKRATRRIVINVLETKGRRIDIY